MYSGKWLPVLLICLLNFHNYLCEHIKFQPNIGLKWTDEFPRPELNSSLIDLSVNYIFMDNEITFQLLVYLSKDEFQKKPEFIKKLYIGLSTEDDDSNDPLDIIGIYLEEDEVFHGNKLCQHQRDSRSDDFSYNQIGKDINLCQIQDSYWNKKTNEIEIDDIQDYEATPFSTAEFDNTNFIRIVFKRKLFTGDNKDFHFSIKNVTMLWWALREVSISSELSLIDAEIRKQSGPRTHSKSLSALPITPINHGLNRTALRERGFREPMKSSFDQLFFPLYNRRGILTLRIFDTINAVPDINEYLCTIDEYRYIRSINLDDHFLYLSRLSWDQEHYSLDGPDVIKQCVVTNSSENIRNSVESSEVITTQHKLLSFSICLLAIGIGLLL